MNFALFALSMIKCELCEGFGHAPEECLALEFFSSNKIFGQ
jgi:hypothetical protein